MHRLFRNARTVALWATATQPGITAMWSSYYVEPFNTPMIEYVLLDGYPQNTHVTVELDGEVVFDEIQDFVKGYDYPNERRCGPGCSTAIMDVALDIDNTPPAPEVTFPANTMVPAGGVTLWMARGGDPGDYTFRLMSGNDGAGDTVDTISFNTDLWTGFPYTDSYQRIPDGIGAWQMAPQTQLALNDPQP